MPVHVLATPYQKAEEAAHIKNWVGKTIGLRLDALNTNDKGETTSLAGSVFQPGALDAPRPVRIESARIIGQLTGFAIGDVVIVTVVPYGQRGQVLAPPAEKDKDAAALAEMLNAESDGS